MNDKQHPVKLPIKPIKMVKWGITIANRMVMTTTATLKPNPQTFNSPSTDQMVGNLVSGLPCKEKEIKIFGAPGTPNQNKSLRRIMLG